MSSRAYIKHNLCLRSSKEAILLVKKISSILLWLTTNATRFWAVYIVYVVKDPSRVVVTPHPSLLPIGRRFRWCLFVWTGTEHRDGQLKALDLQQPHPAPALGSAVGVRGHGLIGPNNYVLSQVDIV